MKSGGSTSICMTSMNCPGQYYHPCLQGVTADPHPQRSPKPPREVEESQRSDNAQSQGAPRELPQGTHMQPLLRRQMSDIPRQKSQAILNVPGT